MNFSVAMARSVQYSTIKNYLSVVKHYHFSHGYELPLSAFHHPQLILTGGTLQGPQTYNFAFIKIY